MSISSGNNVTEYLIRFSLDNNEFSVQPEELKEIKYSTVCLIGSFLERKDNFSEIVFKMFSDISSIIGSENTVESSKTLTQVKSSNTLTQRVSEIRDIYTKLVDYQNHVVYIRAFACLRVALSVSLVALTVFLVTTAPVSMTPTFLLLSLATVFSQLVLTWYAYNRLHMMGVQQENLSLLDIFLSVSGPLYEVFFLRQELTNQARLKRNSLSNDVNKIFEFLNYITIKSREHCKHSLYDELIQLLKKSENDPLNLAKYLDLYNLNAADKSLRMKEYYQLALEELEYWKEMPKLYTPID